MTLTYDRASTSLTITSTLLTSYIAVPTNFTIDITLNGTSITTAPTVDPYVESSVTVDTVYEVIVKLTQISTGAVLLDTGCIFTEGDTSDDCASYYQTILQYAYDNKNIVDENVNKVLLYYNVIQSAQLCPCECDKIKEIKLVLDDEIKDCC